MIKDNSAEHRIGHTGLPPSVVMVAKSAHGDEQEQQKHYFAALLSAIRRGWWLAVPLGICLSLVSAFAAWHLFVPKYAASAYLRIDSDNRPLIFKTADESSGHGNDFKLYKNTHQQLLVTPFVLNAALRDTQVSSLAEIISQEDAIGWLQANLKVKFPGDGEIMQVSVETVSRVGCVQIVNGVVNAFMQEVVQNERNDRLTRLNNLEGVYSVAESKVRNKQGELKSFAAALGTSDTQSLTVAQQSALSQFGKMSEKLSEVQFSLMQAEGELKMADEFERRQNEIREKDALSKSESSKDSQLLPEVDERTADVVRLEEDIAMAKLKLKSLLRDLGLSHPSVVSLVGEIELKNQLLELRKTDAKKRPKMAEGRVADERVLRTTGGVTYDLVALATRTQVLTNQENILKEKVEKLSDETRQLGRSSIDIELMRSEISGLEVVLRRVGDEIERTSIELKTASRIKLLSSAVNATSPDAMKRWTRVIGVGAFALAAPLGLLVLWDFTRKRVNNVEGTSHSLSLPTIATIPRVSRNPLQRGDQVSQRDWNRTRAELDEALDGLASMVLHSAQKDQRKVFMISSAMPGEGKSTVACQLAQGLARAGRTVALVDFDLRRPCIHSYLQLQLDPGVAEALSGECSFDKALQKTDLVHLSVMTAGDWKGNLHERCTSGTVDDLFDFLRRSFDLVIVDSSPVLPVHDSRVLGKFTDGVILTLVRDQSRLPAAAQACEILRAYGVPVLGTVIIGLSSRAYPNYYPFPTKNREPKRLVDVHST